MTLQIIFLLGSYLVLKRRLIAVENTSVIQKDLVCGQSQQAVSQPWNDLSIRQANGLRVQRREMHKQISSACTVESTGIGSTTRLMFSTTISLKWNDSTFKLHISAFIWFEGFLIREMHLMAKRKSYALLKRWFSTSNAAQSHWVDWFKQPSVPPHLDVAQAMC